MVLVSYNPFIISGKGRLVFARSEQNHFRIHLLKPLRVLSPNSASPPGTEMSRHQQVAETRLSVGVG